MKNKVCLFIIFAFIASTFSCSDNDDTTPIQNTASVSLKFNGDLIKFENVLITETALDLDQGLGLRIYGERKFANINHNQYYIVIDLKKNTDTNEYSVHMVNFGIYGQLLTDTYNLNLHYAYNNEQLTTPNFDATILTNGNVISGSFSGIMQNNNSVPQVTISEGYFEFEE